MMHIVLLLLKEKPGLLWPQRCTEFTSHKFRILEILNIFRSLLPVFTE